VLRALRLQDLAGAPEVLARALVQDAVALLAAKIGVSNQMVSLLATQLRPSLDGRLHPPSSATVQTLLAQLQLRARTTATQGLTQAIHDKGLRWLTTAVVSVVACNPPHETESDPPPCDLATQVASNVDAEDAANVDDIIAIASDLYQAANATQHGPS